MERNWRGIGRAVEKKWRGSGRGRYLFLCLQLRISAKRLKITHFDVALKNHVFHRSFFFLKFCSCSTASFKD